MNKTRITKKELKNKIEPFIYDKLDDKLYELETKLSKDLLTWNRIDLAFKILYLELRNKNFKLAEKIYYHDIKAQTLGSFIEEGNKRKNSFEKYIDLFEKIEHLIKKNGFDKHKTIIPLAKDGSILNGAHRIAAAIYHGKDVVTVNTQLPPLYADYQNFFKKNVPIHIIDLAVKTFIKYTNNIYIAFLWPSGGNIVAQSYFSNILYKKKISLTTTGAYNLLVELYKHMDWTGAKENGYPGIKKKLLECFPNVRPFTVIAFQSDCIEKVRNIKQKIRNIYKIGFSSIHITDTKEEAIRISKLIFNENGLHFLNYGKPYKYLNIYEQLKEFEIFIKKNNITKENIIIDSSLVLSVYGLRKNLDIDFLSLQNISYKSKSFEPHDTEIFYHGVPKEELIYNDDYFFEFLGFKFISFNQLFVMKKNRNDKKDLTDIKIMKSLIENKRIIKIIMQLKQKYFYFSIKYKRIFWNGFIKCIKTLKIYYPIRRVYRKIKYGL